MTCCAAGGGVPWLLSQALNKRGHIMWLAASWAVKNIWNIWEKGWKSRQVVKEGMWGVKDVWLYNWFMLGCVNRFYGDKAGVIYGGHHTISNYYPRECNSNLLFRI